ncbi:MAG: thioredoxin domain-containing protein [Patescibacteria group bacterium]|nr:thioredoxin domain-containing protein [Patescibacteria group bacterium]
MNIKKLIIVLIILVAIGGAGYKFFGAKIAGNVLSPEEAKATAEKFIKENLVQAGTEVAIKEVVEEGSLYKIVLSVGGQDYDSYISKDGAKFFPQVLNIKELESEKEKADAAAAAGTDTSAVAGSKVVAKSDKPAVELFVMAFCPYGVQAEGVMAPVFNLLKDKADIKVRFIASVTGDDINSVQSLHGPIEGIEDARQLCVAKNYGQETLWKYINSINKDCYPIYGDGDEVYKTCWQKAAKAAGINTAKIDSCVTDEGAALINAEKQAADQYGVSGSPTLVINGSKSNADRTPEGFKTAICEAFNNPPAECESVISSDAGATAPSGDCN